MTAEDFLPKPSSENSDYKIVPAGNHVARCYSVIILGTIKGEYEGRPNENEKIRLGFELPNELHVYKEGNPEEPMVIGREFTFSYGEKSALRPLLESWRGAKFNESDLKTFSPLNLIGVPCMLNVIHKTSKDGSKTYATISAITPLPRGFQCPDKILEPVIFNARKFDLVAYNALPKFIQSTIQESNEYKALNLKNVQPQGNAQPAANQPNTVSANTASPSSAQGAATTKQQPSGAPAAVMAPTVENIDDLPF